MQRIDVLRGSDRRFDVITGELLADRRDDALQDIVARARSLTDAPTAGVSLVLQTIQYFRADDGLPDDLVHVRAVARDTAFCQFVVRDGAPFAVEDVSRREGVPRDLLDRYGLQSYLGHPVQIDGAVLGSLCVFDKAPRTFDKGMRTALAKLAADAEDRLLLLAERGRDTPAPMRASLEPAVAALNNRLRPLRPAIVEARVAALEVQVLTRALGRRDISQGLIENLAPALSAVEVLQSRLAHLEGAAEAAMRGIELLREVASPTYSATGLVDLVEAAGAIADPLTAAVGGVRWRLPLVEYTVALPRPQAVAFLGTALATLAGLLRRRTVRADLHVEISALRHEVHIDITAARLRFSDGETVRASLRALGIAGTSAQVIATGQTVQLVLPAVPSTPSTDS